MCSVYWTMFYKESTKPNAIPLKYSALFRVTFSVLFQRTCKILGTAIYFSEWVSIFVLFTLLKAKKTYYILVFTLICHSPFKDELHVK